MKSLNLTFLLLSVIAGSVSYAQSLVALHHNGTVQHFSGANALVNAYAASSNGDSIYLPWGSFVPPPNFDKSLTMYGAGHYQDSTQATGKSFIGGIVTLNENADNFHMEGIEVLDAFNFSANASVNQVTIKYCKINGPFQVLGNLTNPSNNIALIGNVIVGDVVLSNASNVAIYNSILQGHLTNSVANLFYNCIFLFNGGNYDWVINGEMVNNNLYNSVFYQSAWGQYTNITGNTYKYNIFTSATPNFGTGAVSENNYFGIAQGSIFINQTGNGFDYTHNYHLQLPLTYLGSDGSQLGLYGGYFPYKE
ncbi:MAG TPA: hypothetical protein VLR49_04595, partial [Ferruginibacter sp.]|nr:hypothetical protein [Ferruginibacter sp.]